MWRFPSAAMAAKKEEIGQVRAGVTFMVGVIRPDLRRHTLTKLLQSLLHRRPAEVRKALELSRNPVGVGENALNEAIGINTEHLSMVGHLAKWDAALEVFLSSDQDEAEESPRQPTMRRELVASIEDSYKKHLLLDVRLPSCVYA